MFARLSDLVRDRAGAAVAEFAIVTPVLMVGLLGVIQFGIVFYDYMLVEDAAQVGERTLLQNRPFPTTNLSCIATCPTACFTPYSSTVSAIQNATNLPVAQLAINLSVAGTQCTSDASCGTALCSARRQAHTRPRTRQVSPCHIRASPCCRPLGLRMFVSMAC